MTKEYLKFCGQYESDYENMEFTPKQKRLIHASLGLAGEAGEVVDAIKKHLIYGIPLNEEHIKIEIGDMFFYTSNLISELNTTYEEIMQLNMDKIKAKSPSGKFTDSSEVMRKEEFVWIVSLYLQGVAYHVGVDKIIKGCNLVDLVGNEVEERREIFSVDMNNDCISSSCSALKEILDENYSDGFDFLKEYDKKDIQTLAEDLLINIEHPDGWRHKRRAKEAKCVKQNQ